MYSVIIDSKGIYKSVADKTDIIDILKYFNKRDVNLENFRRYQTD